ncbi:hypothetical protein ACT3R8_11680 [Halomonas sp. AOP42-C2-23]|uniref:hypothetical protein n=1 Tax=Halomonas sp. AOP42-C2-23 TaxID=3457669 RepID=UPI0040348858
MKFVFIMMVIVFLNGCATGSQNSSYSPSSLTDDGLLQRILSGMVIPTSYHVYSDDLLIENNEDIELDEVVYRNSSCVISELRSNATRTDLEIINALWVESDGSAKDVIIDSVGELAYFSGVEAYSNATFDCGLMISRWLNEMDS